MLQLMREKKYPIYPARKVLNKRIQNFRFPNKIVVHSKQNIPPLQKEEPDLICLDLTEVN